MYRYDAERVIKEYVKPVFGFTLKRCRNIQDAEDLSQEIMLKAFRALIMRDDIDDADKFIWTVAHNALVNYYRDKAKNAYGVSLDEIGDIADEMFSDDDDNEAAKRLQSEIAYLSKLQRSIVIAYYYENKKQADIASALGIPLGTVKWHLFEAKKELKKGMEKMRESSQLKFNPVKFNRIAIDGSAGTRSVGEFLRSSLSQNICYDIRNEAKSVEEIADDLGVSPVYIESEIDNLYKFGLLTEKNGKFTVNFLLIEETPEFLIAQDEMYKKAAKLFAPDLYDELMSSGVIDDKNIVCNQMLPGSTCEEPLPDINFRLWSLIPFITASSGKKDNERIKFEEVATLRPDGGHNIFEANVDGDKMKLPDGYLYMKDWCGPAVFSREGNTVWRVDTEWSGKRISVDSAYYDQMMRVIGDYDAFWSDELLSESEYAWLSELGLIKTWGDYDKCFKVSWKVTQLRNKEIKDKLIELGDRVRERHEAEFEKLKAQYIKSALNTVPAHMRRAREYELQFLFSSDSWFILHCIKALLDEGKLKLPTEEQKKALSTIIYVE
ncbi:MAG: RNA polymerase sigma factor [Clostridia bacterium]|nr:RNA polymerase sigma factor [Clostridia bacterium]